MKAGPLLHWPCASRWNTSKLDDERNAWFLNRRFFWSRSITASLCYLHSAYVEFSWRGFWEQSMLTSRYSIITTCDLSFITSLYFTCLSICTLLTTVIHVFVVESVFLRPFPYLINSFAPSSSTTIPHFVTSSLLTYIPHASLLVWILGSDLNRRWKQPGKVSHPTVSTLKHFMYLMTNIREVRI